ncbi:MAG: hypothetical protein U0Q11_08250 [Vicinamibacterales bacterium]
MHLLDRRQILEREVGVGWRAKRRLDDPVLDQIAQMIVAKRRVARQQIARAIQLPGQL